MHVSNVSNHGVGIDNARWVGAFIWHPYRKTISTSPIRATTQPVKDQPTESDTTVATPVLIKPATDLETQEGKKEEPFCGLHPVGWFFYEEDTCNGLRCSLAEEPQSDKSGHRHSDSAAVIHGPSFKPTSQDNTDSWPATACPKDR